MFHVMLRFSIGIIKVFQERLWQGWGPGQRLALLLLLPPQCASVRAPVAL